MPDDIKVTKGNQAVSEEARLKVRDAMKAALDKELTSGVKGNVADAAHGNSSVMGAGALAAGGTKSE
jgi:hypothetical protein